MNATGPATKTRKYQALVLGASSLAILVGVSLGFSSPAEAQALRPNILVLFDTSGSMLYNQANDGSPLCSNNANGQTSRIYNMKHALRDALAEVGTDEANFGLMRFPQTFNSGQADNCPQAFWSNANTSVSGNAGCRMTTQSDNPNSQTSYGTWFDNGIAQALLIPVTLSSTGLKPGGASDYDPLGANITSIYRWIDQSESSSAASYTDPELRIPPNNNTPLGRSLFYARLYFENYVYPNDPRKDCRQNIVIIATDGAETCDTTAGTALNTTTCATTGTYGAFHPEVTACALNHSAVIPKGVQTYILTDSGLTTNEKAAANRIAAAGGTGSAIFVTLTNTAAVKSALVGIIAQNVPPGETCNGKDDNCNSLIDEGVSNQCLTCTPGNTNPNCGSFVINPNSPTDPDNLLGAGAKHCAIETCNCLDDNCNGKVDEGLPVNACGGPCGCAVPAEKCNGLDDNCDGIIDNASWPTGAVGAKCNNGLTGACNRDGILVCNAAGTDTVCSAPTVTVQQEVCNGVDDNCDGQIDNPPAGSMLPGVGEACGNGLGACQSGTIVCKNGKLQCNVTSTPQPEVCDGIDNDCDGIVDDGNFTADRPALPLPRPDAGPGRRGHLPGRPSAVHGRARVRLRRLRAPLGGRGLQRQGQQLRRQDRHHRQLPERVRLQGRRLLAPVQGRRVPLPARLQVLEQLLHPAALRQRPALPHRPDVRRSDRLLRRRLCGSQVHWSQSDLRRGPLRQLLRRRVRLPGGTALPGWPLQGRSLQGGHLHRSPVLLERRLRRPLRRNQVPGRPALRQRQLPPRSVRRHVLPARTVLQSRDGRLRAEPLPRHPVPGRRSLRLDHQHLQAGSLRHHQLPEHLLDLRRHHRRPRDLHAEGQLPVGHHQRRPARRR